jgi:LPXTG-motif cell wall-anchored protein
MRRVLHRLLAGSAAAFLVAGAMALPAAPALATVSAPTVYWHFPAVSVAPGAAKIEPLYAWVAGPYGELLPRLTGPLRIGRMTVTIDTAGVQDLATVKAVELESGDKSACPAVGTLITCTLDGPVLFAGQGSMRALLAVQVTGKAGATEGADGRLNIAVLTGGRTPEAIPPVTSSPDPTGTDVTIGEGVDLAGFNNTQASEVAAGAAVDTGLKVANTGTKTAHGVVLVLLGWDPSLVEARGFRNCSYGVLTTCTFDDDLAPGTTYELSSPMRLKIPADAAAGSRARVFGSWYEKPDFVNLFIGISGDGPSGLPSTDGTGPEVHLRPVAKPAVTPGKDAEPDNNVLLNEVTVTGGEKPDEAAVGATVTGAVGEKVAAKVGFVNNGPGTLYHWTFGNTDVVTEVKVPAGLTVIKADKFCLPVAVDDYVCFTSGKYTAAKPSTKAKASTVYDFTFKVKSASTAGTVVINGDELSGRYELDRSAGDDTAALKVELGEGGGLPVTGSNAAVIGGAGVLLAAAGVFGVVLFRRRRVRFTA